MPGVSAGRGPSKDDQRRDMAYEVTSLSSQIQRMNLVDAKKYQGDKKILAILKQARDHLTDLIGDEDMGDMDEPEETYKAGPLMSRGMR